MPDYKLIIECGGKRVEFPLTRGTFTVGRDPSCDITFHEQSLSRRHLQWTIRGSEIVVSDLGSRNGTFLGPQRIEEVHLRPEVRLRAGNCMLHIEEEISETTASFEPPPREAQPVAGDDLKELDELLPDDESFEEDSEPTPVDEHVSEAAQADAAGATRLVVRDDRWFVQDLATGAEVEIKPVTGGGKEEGEEPAPAMLPAVRGEEPAQGGALIRAEGTAVGFREARPAEAPGWFARLWADKRRRMRLLIALLAVLVVGTVAAVVLQPPPPPTPIPQSEYHAIATRAARLAHEGNYEAAGAVLADLMSKPYDGRMRLAEMLQRAFDADQAALKNFSENWADGEAVWEEIEEFSATPLPLREIADARLQWYREESQYMGYLNDARRFLEEGNYEEAVRYANSIPSDSLFAEQVEPVIAEANRALLNSVLARAKRAEEAQNWDAAIRALREAIQAEPSLQEELQGRLEQAQANAADKRVIESARSLMEQGNYAQALADLERVGEDSPYASAAEALRAQGRMQGATQRAISAYNGGDGDEALRILDEAGLSDSSLYSKIKRVLEQQQRALNAMQNNQFHVAEDAWQAITEIEDNAQNYYLTEAQRELRLIPQRKKFTSRQLVQEAQQAIRNKDFREAQQKFSTALSLDPTNSEALEGLDQLKRDAVIAYNQALGLRRSNPELALKLLQEVCDRLPPTHRVYVEAQRELRNIKARMEE